jgi:NADH-quinone oxidoreductase subunit I
MFERVAKLVKTERMRSWRLDQLARSIFLDGVHLCVFLAMRYFFKPKATINYPFERGPILTRFAASFCRAALSNGGGALYRLQAARRSARHRPSPIEAGERRDDGTAGGISLRRRWLMKRIYCGFCQGGPSTP